MALNAEWHRAHVMPKNATQEQRLAWHLEHRDQCGCRPIPAGLAALAPPPGTESRTALRALLAGGDRRSVAKSKAALAAVLAAPARVGELVALLDDGDWLVAMRAVDLLEKVARLHPEWVQPHRARLIGPLADAEQWEVRLQVVRALPLLEWTPRERKRVVAILRRDVEHPQKFVRAWALDGLATFAQQDAALRAEVERHLALFERSGSKALETRARNVRARLSA
jgi:hypothetical protein